MRVFLSSTYFDLSEIRKEIESTVRRAGWDTKQMEFFGARPESPLDVSLAELRDSDLMVLVIAGRYGTIPPGSDLSITHHEFREAIRLSRPVLAFVADSGDEPTGKEADRLREFISEVGQEVTYQKVESADKIPLNVVAGLTQHVLNHGEQGRAGRVFPSFEAYFAALLDEDAVFTHAYDVVGRDAEIDQILSFLKSQKKVCVVVGPGGAGKSKLLYEVARRVAKASDSSLPQLRFYRNGLAIDAAAFRELPAENVCIVADDAHRIVQPADFVDACRSQPCVEKIILTTRPGILGATNRALRSIPDDQVERISLKALNRRTDAVQLAKSLIGPDDPIAATKLANLADGNPLLITVGARLLQKRGVSSDILDRVDEFVDAALEGLLEKVPDPVYGTIQRDPLLGLLAAIQPFETSETLHKLLGIHLKCQPSEIAKAIDGLEFSQLLLRRGRWARITPDVLGDHLLYRRALTTNGQSTGFVDEVVGEFGREYLANIILNGAELDWRSKVKGGHASVMEQVWNWVLASLPNRTFRERRDLLSGLLRPAYFAPERVFEIADWCIRETTAPKDEDPIAAFVDVGHQSVLDAACELLAVVGRSPEYAERCAEILWHLARVDGRNPNPRPDHPFRVLKDLASYRTDNDLRTIVGVLQGLSRAIDRNEHIPAKCAITDVIDASLEREVEYIESDRKTVTIGARRLAIERVRRQRELSVSLLRRLALGRDADSAAKAVQSLSQLLMVPRFRFGRETTSEDLATFLPEASETVDLLATVAKDGKFQVIRHLAHQALLECNAKEWNGLKSQIEGALDGLSSQPDAQALELLLCPDGRLSADTTWEERRRDGEAACNELAKKLWSNATNEESIVSILASLCDELRQAGLDFEPGPISYAVGENAPTDKHLIGFCNALVASSPSIRHALPVVLRLIRKKGLHDQFDAITFRMARSEDIQIRKALANGLRQIFLGGDPPREQALKLVEIVAKDHESEIRGAALEALARFGESEPRGAIAALINADFGTDSDVADRALSCLVRKNGIEPDALSDAEVDAMLEKLRQLDSIDDHHSHISDFLEYAATRRPFAVLEMLLGRIDDTQLPDHAKRDGYQPIPYLADNLRVARVENQEDRLRLLRMVRDRMTNESWQHQEYLPRLFKCLVNDLKDAVLVCKEWGMTTEPEKVVAAVRLLKAMPHGLLSFATDVFADILGNADRLGSDCYERVSSALYILSDVKEARFVNPGEPDPHYSHQRTWAQDKARQYESRPPVARFFRNLADSAQHWLKVRLDMDAEEDL